MNRSFSLSNRASQLSSPSREKGVEERFSERDQFYFFSFGVGKDFLPFFSFLVVDEDNYFMDDLEGVFQRRQKPLQKRNTKQRTNANSFRATVGAPPREKILRRADDDGGDDDDDDDDDSKKNALLVRVLHVFFSFFSSTRNVVTNEERHIRFLFWSSTKQLSRDDE